MQEFTYEHCLSLDEEKTITLTDTRDNSQYTVAKLKDGKCWMTRNLRIINKKLTSSGSDVSSDLTIPASSNRSSWNELAHNALKANYNNSIDYGSLYTWYTATAGWRLPTNAEFNILTSTYSRDEAQSGVPNFGSKSWAGRCYQYGCPSGSGSFSYWWSSTAYSSNNAYFLKSDSSRFDADHGIEGFGYSVRCVAREPKKITDLQYLQDWDTLSADEKSQVLSSMDDGKNYTLTDKRDNNQYTVSKLKDGELWMTQNLRIGSNSGTTPLDSSTSDVASTFTLPQGTTKTASSSSSTTGWHYAQYNTAHIYIDSNTNYGGYYTWYAATAGEGTSSMSSGNTSHSICPKGWTLPTSDQITALTSQYNSTTKDSNPPNFGVYAGYCDEGGCPRNQGSYGRWWSSTANASDYAYVLNAYSSDFYLNNNHSKGVGYSVRCVARGA